MDPNGEIISHTTEAIGNAQNSHKHYHVSGAQSAIPVNAWASCGPMLKRGNGQHYSAYRLLYRGPSCLLTGPTIRDADADRQTLNRQFET